MDILNLPGWSVLDVHETDHDLRIVAEYDTQRVVCHHCGAIDSYRRYGKVSQLVMDAPIRAKRVGLEIQRIRFQCRDCNKTFIQQLPDIDDKRATTKRLIAYIEKESLKRTFTTIAGDVGVDEKTVRNIFRDHVKRLEATIHIQTPEWLGMDELKLMKQTRGIITNVKESTVVDMLRNRNLATVRPYLWKMPNKERIQVVAMDMWDPYRIAVNEILPNAQIIVDKFHVVRMANDALDAVRKGIRKGLTDRQRRTLMHDRFILLKREWKLKPHQILKRDAWFGSFPTLHLAYQLKEEYYDLWEVQTGAEAAARYDAWEAKIPKELESAFKALTTAMTNWRQEIFAHFDYGRVTNAYTENVNGMAKLIARNGRGYSFEAVRAKVLYGNGLKMQARPKYDKRKNLGLGLQSAVKFSGGVEAVHYDTLGNEISTWLDEWGDDADSSVSTRSSE